MIIGSDYALYDNTITRNGAVPLDSEKANKEAQQQALQQQKLLAQKEKLTVAQDIEFKLQQKKLLEEKKESPFTTKQYDQSPTNRNTTSSQLSANQQNVLTKDDQPIARKAINAYESTATLEKRQEIESLVGFDGFA